jgi:hypothetical protein
MLKLKMLIPFCKKIFPQKSFYLVVMQPKDGNTKIKFMLRILEKIHVGPETN